PTLVLPEKPRRSGGWVAVGAIFTARDPKCRSIAHYRGRSSHAARRSPCQFACPPRVPGALSLSCIPALRAVRARRAGGTVLRGHHWHDRLRPFPRSVVA